MYLLSIFQKTQLIVDFLEIICYKYSSGGVFHEQKNIAYTNMYINVFSILCFL